MLWSTPAWARYPRLRFSLYKTSLSRSRYLAEDTGSLTVFTLFCFVLILMLCGMGVDLMRYESQRVALQNTLDRAVLAAADMDQTLDPDLVVQDYFAKAGISGATVTTEVDDRDSYRSVSATSSLTVRPFFMHLVGVNGLSAPASGGAREGLTMIEISLVLDISKSMDSNRRLDNLKVAAKEFVDTVLANNSTASKKLTHVSIVPFSTQVNAGASLASYLNLTNNQTASNCADFTTDQYNSAALPSTVSQAAHFDPDGNRLADSGWRPVCMTGTNQQIAAFEDDAETLKSYIEALSTDYYTSIEIGAKWGAALLDPSIRASVASMAADGVVDEDFDGRPYNYDNRDVLKVMIVMSDGANTKSWEIADTYKSGASNIWYDSSAKLWSARNMVTGDYYIQRLGTTATEPDGANARQLSWPEVWKLATVDWVSRNLMRGLLGSSSKADAWYNSVVTGYETAAKDARTSAVCGAAKDKGVTVYTIGFETDSDGDATLRNCASSAGHFFHAKGTQISSVFAVIASDISQLKLTN